MLNQTETDRPAQLRDGLRRACLWLVTILVLLVLLVQARRFLLPLVIAVLVFSLTSALIDRLVKLQPGGIRIPNWLASTVAVCLVGAVLLTVSSILSGQINKAVLIAPAYVERAQAMLTDALKLMNEDAAQGLLDAIRDIRINSYLRAAAGSAGQVLFTTTLVTLYVAFLFAEKPWLRPKLQQLARDPQKAEKVAAIISSIRDGIHHYLLVKTLVSALTGLTIYAILRAFQIDFAETVALLTFLLNYIPNVGTVAATLLAILVGAVQLGEFEPILLLSIAVVLTQFVLGNVVDPMMMGRALRMSSLGIVVSLTFWGAVWGVAGMFLAIPFMVTIAIICAHVPALRPVAILLSRDGTLPGSPAPVAEPEARPIS